MVDSNLESAEEVTFATENHGRAIIFKRNGSPVGYLNLQPNDQWRMILAQLVKQDQEQLMKELSAQEIK